MASGGPMPFPFPLLGVDRNFGLADQPPGTCPDARNVRTYDGLGNRARGGQRHGCSKAFTNALSTRVLDLAVYNRPFQQSASGPTSPIYQLDPDSFAAGTNLATLGGADALDGYNAITSASVATSTVNATGTVRAMVSASSPFTNCIRFDGVSSPTTGDAMRGLIPISPGPGITSGRHYQVGATLLAASNDSSDDYQAVDADSAFTFCIGFRIPTARNAGLHLRIVPASVTPFILNRGFTMIPADVQANWGPLSGADLPIEIVIIDDPDTDNIEVYANDVLRAQWNALALSGTEAREQVAWGVRNSSSLTGNFVFVRDLFVREGTPPPFNRRRVIVTAFGDDLVRVGTLAFQPGAFSDPAGAVLEDNGTLTSMVLFEQVYAVNGVENVGGGEGGIIVDPVAITSVAWDKSGTTERPNGFVCAAWRGCAVIAADPDNANNLYISAVGDPLDYDFGEDPIQTSAFALDLSELGRSEDAIIALMPFTDDILGIGGMGSLWVLRGDPRVGGQLNAIARSTGLMGQRAYCWGPGGWLFCLTTDGLIRWNVASGEIFNLSSSRLNDILGGFDFRTLLISMAYHPSQHGIYIYLTDQAAGASVHVFYGIREGQVSQEIWLDDFAGNLDIGPTAAGTVIGNVDDLRTVILGGFDGYVRRYDPTEVNDDGTAIDSWIEYAIQTHPQTQGMTEALMRELHFVGVNGSGNLTWTMRAGKSAEQVARDELTGSVTGTIVPGFQVARTRLRFGAVQLRLENDAIDEGWAIEQAIAFADPKGRRR